MKARTYDWDEQPRRRSSKKQTIMPYAFLVFALLAMAFMVKPALVGYSVHEEVSESQTTSLESPVVVTPTENEDFMEMQNELIVGHTSLASCSSHNTQLLGEIEKYSDKIADCKSDLSAALTEKNIAYDNLDKERIILEDKLREMRLELGKESDDNDKYVEEAQLETEKAQKQRDEIQSKYDSLLAQFNQIDSLQGEYDALARNAAHNICCKARVDNPQISGYQVSSNVIQCTISGGKALTC